MMATNWERRARGQSGLGLVEIFLALTITALIAVPVFGTLIVVLKTGGTSGSAISGQNQRVATQFNRSIKTIEAETAFREDWRVASIIKVNPPQNGGQGIECNNTPGENKWLVSLQRGARYGQDADASVFKTPIPPETAGPVPPAANGKGMIRVVYHLTKRGNDPDGSPVYDLLRRECAVTSSGGLEVAPIRREDCPTAAPAGYLDVDCGGWRLQPGSINSGFATAALGNVAELCPPAWSANPKQNWPMCWTSGPLPPTVIFEGVKSVSAKRLLPIPSGAWATSPSPQPLAGLPGMAAGTCNDRLAVKEPVNGVRTVLQYEPRCDVELSVAFGDGRTQVIRLYQGFSS